MYIDQARERYQVLSQICDDTDPPKPCTSEQIQELSDRLGLRLPQAYIEFLEWTGRGGGCFAGHEFDYGRIEDFNQKDIDSLLTYYGKAEGFPDDAIIIIFYQGGYESAFIRLSEGENPPVHSIIETSDGGLKITWGISESIALHCLRTIEYLISVYSR
jgi:hypothetical protein